MSDSISTALNLGHEILSEMNFFVRRNFEHNYSAFVIDG